MVLSVIFLTWTTNLDFIKPARPRTFEEKYAYARQKWNEVQFDYSMLKTGDLLFRRGKSFFSNQLRKYSLHETKYSHCGFVSLSEDGTPLVFHSIGGTDNPNARIRCDSVFVFCDANEVSAFAVYRYRVSEQIIHRADSIARTFYKKRLAFDMNFDLNDDEKLYCAEFIYKIWIYATKNRNFIPLSVTAHKTYVGIDDLYLNNHSQKIFEYEYR